MRKATERRLKQADKGYRSKPKEPRPRDADLLTIEEIASAWGISRQGATYRLRQANIQPKTHWQAKGKGPAKGLYSLRQIEAAMGGSK